MPRCLLSVALLLLAVSSAVAGVDADRLARIDDAVKEGITRGNCPGAVVLVLHRGQVVYRKAFGQRAKQPETVAMTIDTVFDLASLTKPIATASSVMLLVERGKLKVSDPVAKYLPAFAAKGKDKITLENLLSHTSGLIADNPVRDYQDGREKAIERIFDLEPLTAPGERFLYSDVNFIVLGLIVEQVAKKPLDEFATENIFQPLGMTATGFRPKGALKDRAAPTEKRDGKWMQGEVHDPRAYLLGGVAGHAGLFGTADDLAVFAECLLNGGEYKGKRIFQPETVRMMTAARAVPGGLRTYGWDMATSYSANRGERFRRGVSFGHTGFTGTSLWIDPETQTAVVFLSNRVHPDGKGNVTRLRGRVATLAADALKTPPNADVLTGIDVLVRDGFTALKGRKIGLVTNHTGLDREGRTTIDLLHRADGVTLVALFSPEHGIRGAVDEKVDDTKDEKTGLPVYSLYGKRRKPDARTLEGIDTLVYDIQDAGCRYYTYISTLGLVLEAAAEHKVRVVVLDRPNPIGGLAVEGPILDAGRESFVGYHALPVRHGMTVGELARLFKAEKKLTLDLKVIEMEGWRRGDYFDRTNLRWVNPSPNLRSLTQTLLYPGVGLLETTNVSVGRGTDRPFEWVGAPWIDGRKLAAALAKEGVAGVRFVPLRLTPTSSVHKDRACGGVQLIVDDWDRFRPVRTGLMLATTLRRLYPDDWKMDRFDVLLLHKATWEGVKKGTSWTELEKAWQADLARFRERRASYLLYAE
jgi:uncharacterized protein YbbC (DUF1343 family)/CubicO group peptidase (beta-lactamase class C family)